MSKDNDSATHNRAPLPTSNRRRPLPPARSDWPFGPRHAPERTGETFRPDPMPLRDRRSIRTENLDHPG